MPYPEKGMSLAGSPHPTLPKGEPMSIHGIAPAVRLVAVRSAYEALGIAGLSGAASPSLEATVKLRIDYLLLVTGTAAILFIGAPGCASKAVEEAPAPPPPPPVATAPPVEEAPPVIEAPPPVFTPPDLDPAFFGFDSSILSESAREALDRDAKTLREQSALEVTIEGHCDERGSSEYNMALGERRARAARDYLVASGVAYERIQIVSYGEEQPFDEGHNEAAWAENRRAHFVVRQAELGESPTSAASE